MKSSFMNMLLTYRQELAILGLLLLSGTLVSFTANIGYASIEITPPPAAEGSESENISTINFTATFVNGTKAVVHNQNITEAQSNMLVQILSGLIAGKELGELQNLQDLEEFEEEKEEEPSDDNGGGGSGGGDDGGFNPDEPLPPGIEPGLNPPIDENPPGNGSGDGDGGDEGGDTGEA